MYIIYLYLEIQKIQRTFILILFIVLKLSLVMKNLHKLNIQKNIYFY